MPPDKAATAMAASPWKTLAAAAPTLAALTVATGNRALMQSLPATPAMLQAAKASPSSAASNRRPHNDWTNLAGAAAEVIEAAPGVAQPKARPPCQEVVKGGQAMVMMTFLLLHTAQVSFSAAPADLKPAILPKQPTNPPSDFAGTCAAAFIPGVEPEAIPPALSRPDSLVAAPRQKCDEALAVKPASVTECTPVAPAASDTIADHPERLHEVMTALYLALMKSSHVAHVWILRHAVIHGRCACIFCLFDPGDNEVCH